MLEIFNILFLNFLLFFLLGSPLIIFKKNYDFNLINYHENLIVNLALILNFLLITSFFSIKLEYVFCFLIILCIFFSLKNFKIFRCFFGSDLVKIYFISIIISFFIASNLKLEWDPAAIWIYRVINFYDNYNFQNLKNVPGVLSYPHLGTYLWAFLWKISLVDAEYTGRIFFAFLLTISFALIAKRFAKNTLQYLILFIFFIFISYDSFIAGGYLEYPIFSLYLIINYYLEKIEEQKKNIANFFVILLLCNSIIWFKNETAFFVILLIFSYLTNFRDVKYKILTIIIVTILFFTKYFIFYSFFQELNVGWQGYGVNKLNIILNFDYIYERVSFIFLHIFIAIIKTKILFIFLVSLFFIKKKLLKEFTPYIVFILLSILFVFLIYFLTNSADWKIYIATTADRLLFQISSVFLIPIIKLFYRLNKFIKF